MYYPDSPEERPYKTYDVRICPNINCTNDGVQTDAACPTCQTATTVEELYRGIDYLMAYELMA